MKRCFLLCIIFYGINGFSQVSSISLDLFVGTWKAVDSPNYEVWEKINDSLFVGNSFELNGKEKTLNEVFYMEKRNDSIIYTATVFNQNKGKSIPFVLKTSIAETFSFENENHDFPKKIQYHFINLKKLEVRISGDVEEPFIINLEKH
jgi:hypothetical protein